MLIEKMLELAIGISLIRVGGGTFGTMDGEYAGTRVESILESWMGQILEDGLRISWNYGWRTLWNMLGTNCGIVDGEHAGNMGGEYLWNHGWRTC